MAFAPLALGFLVAAVVTGLLIPILRKVALTYGLVDSPDGKRKIHDRPVPIVGGLAIAAGFACGLCAMLISGEMFSIAVAVPPVAYWVGAGLVLVAGFYDDIRGLDFKHKFAVQIIAALVLIHAGVRVDVGSLPFVDFDPYYEALYSIVLTLLWVVGLMNAVNLIDGLDGLAGGVVLIAFTALAIAFGIQGDLAMMMLGAVLVGALVAFLAYNTHPASVFMGDAGSLFLGYALAAFSLQGRAHVDPLIALVIPVIVLGLPVLDTTLAIFRRFSKGQSICAPDKDHIHHRLAGRWTTRNAVFILYTAAITFGTIAILMVFAPPSIGLTLAGSTLLVAGLGLSTLGYEPVSVVKSAFRRISLALSPTPLPLSEDVLADIHVETPSPQATPSYSTVSGDGSSTNTVPRFEVHLSTHKPFMTIDPSAVVEMEDDVQSANLEGETVVLDLKTGTYFGLNGAGSSIFSLIDEPRSVSSIIETLQSRYDADRDRLHNDVLGFLNTMQERKLVRVVNRAAA